MDTEGEFNGNTEINTTENEQTDEPQTTEVVEYQNHMVQGVDTLVNISIFNGFFLGAILGAIVISIFFKNTHV